MLKFALYARHRGEQREGFVAWDYCLITQPTRDFIVEGMDEMTVSMFDIECSLGLVDWAAHIGVDDADAHFPFLAAEGWEVYHVSVGENTPWPEERWDNWRYVPGYNGWAGEQDRGLDEATYEQFLKEVPQ